MTVKPSDRPSPISSTFPAANTPSPATSSPAGCPLPAPFVQAAPSVRAPVGQNVSSVHATPTPPSAVDESKRSGLPPGVRYVTAADEKWHDMGAEHPFGYEWLYFDLVLDDGSALALNFLSPNPFVVDLPTLQDPKGIPKSTGMLVQLKLKNGQHFDVLDFRKAGKVEFTEKPHWRLRIDDNEITMSEDKRGLRTYHLHLDAVNPTDGVRVKGEFYFASEKRGTMIDEGVTASNATTGDVHRWFVTVPEAKAKGRLDFFDKTGKRIGDFPHLSGTGYHDHNTGTRLLGQDSDGWNWFRMVLGDGTVVNGAHLLGHKKANPADPNETVSDPSNILQILDGNGLKVFDSRNNVTYAESPTRVTHGLLSWPEWYTLSAKGTDGKSYSIRVTPGPVTKDLGYYVRQQSSIAITVDGGAPRSGDAVGESIYFPAYLQLLLQAATPPKATEGIAPPRK